MELDLKNDSRPSAALQKAMGNGAPRLDDAQCEVFYQLVQENGGLPFGHGQAQQAFRERYTIDGDRWVERTGDAEA